MEVFQEPGGHMSYDFSRCSSFKEAYDLFETIVSNHLHQYSEATIVAINYIDDSGVIKHRDVHVYPSYFDAVDTINKHEYSKNAVKVSMIRRVSDHAVDVVHVKCKVFDEYCYSSLAACTVDRIDDFRFFSRELWDTNGVMYLH